MSKTLSVCVGGLLVVIKCIYLPPTYLYSIQDIEDGCLLLTSSTSFVDLPSQEHRMTEKHHMDQNPYILIMSKTRGLYGQYDMKGRRGTRPGPSWPKVGLTGHTPLARGPGPGVFPKTIFTMCQCKSVRGVSNLGKVVEQLNVAARPSFMAVWHDKWASCAQSSTRAPPYSSYKYLSAPLGRKCEESEVLPTIVLPISFL
jgi:hypothetical protein